MEVSPEIFPLTPEVRRIGRAIHEAGGRPVLVGGWVRDCLLGIPDSKDFDLEVFGLPPGKLQKTLARFGPVITVGRHFGVLKLSTRRAGYDVSVPRRESKIGKGHKQFRVEPDPTMTFEQAASRRDFTINAMGYDFLDGRLMDHFHGRRDLQERRLRHVGPAFGEDPLRVLRAMQFAGRFDLAIDPETLAICRGQDLSELPRERIWEELKKLLLLAGRPSRGLVYAEPLGILAYFPELARLATSLPVAEEIAARTRWEQTLAVMDRAAAMRSGDAKSDLVLMTGALCHQIREPEGGETEQNQSPAVSGAQTFASQHGKKTMTAAERAIRTFLARLTQETALPEAVVTVVRELDMPQRLYDQRKVMPDGDIRRLALRISIPFLLKLATAAFQGTFGQGAISQGFGGSFDAGEWLDWRARELGVYEAPPRPVIKGRHLLEMGLAPGPGIGEILERVFERQLDGTIGSKEEAMAWVRQECAPGDDAPVNPSANHQM